LIKNGLVQVSTEHVENTYCVSDEKEIIELLVKYKPYYRTEGFTDAWADLEWPGLSKTEEDEPQK